MLFKYYCAETENWLRHLSTEIDIIIQSTVSDDCVPQKSPAPNVALFMMVTLLKLVSV